jgi:glutaredoxin
MSRTKKRNYTGSKAVDSTCRSHGSCPWCKRAREYKVKKRKKLQENTDDYRGTSREVREDD